MLLRITIPSRRLIIATAVSGLAVVLLLYPLPVKAATESWYLRSNAGAACGSGDRESLNQTEGTSAATKVLDSTGDTWNRTETARTIGAGTWQLFFDADTTSVVGGSPNKNKVTVLVERRNSSCVVQGSAIINVEVTTTEGGIFENSDASASAGDILTMTLTKTGGDETITLRYDDAASGNADSRLVHPGEPITVSVSDTATLKDSAQSAVAAAGLTESVARVLGISMSLSDIPKLSESMRVALGAALSDTASFKESVAVATGFPTTDNGNLAGDVAFVVTRVEQEDGGDYGGDLASTIGDLATSKDDGLQKVAVRFICDLASSNKGKQEEAADIIGDLASSNNGKYQEAAVDIIGDLVSSNNGKQLKAATNIIGVLASSNKGKQQKAATDILGALATSNKDALQEAAADIIGALATSNDEALQEAAAGIIGALATCNHKAFQEAATDIGLRAALEVEDAAEITAIFNAVSENPDVLANLEIPHEALAAEVPPTPGEGGWYSTGSPAPRERILTKFTRKVPSAHIAIEKHNGLPSWVSPLPSDQVVNAILRFTPENFQPEDMISNHVTFYVDKAWLKARRIHPWSVQFSRFDLEKGTWDPLHGKLVREDAERIFYTVAPSRFSLWAISGASKVPPMRFRSDRLKISPLQAHTGQDVRIQLQVTNVTAQPQEYNAVLWLNGQVHASKSLTIDNNSTEPVIFDVRLNPGNYKVRVDKLYGVLTISSPTPEGGSRLFVGPYPDAGPNGHTGANPNGRAKTGPYADASPNVHTGHNPNSQVDANQRT